MKSIVIIGAGQLGSRHLQALRLIDEPIRIQVVDPSHESLKVAEERFNQVKKDFFGEIQFLTEIDLVASEIFLAIVATNSIVRRHVIERLVQLKTVKYLVLEKVLFSESCDYEIVDKLLKDKNIKCWVNCPRRMFPVYQELKEHLKGKLNMVVEANNFGLGCNGIHMVDLFAYLTGENEIIISNEFLDEEILESKRKGYIEFSGTITGTTKRRDLFQLTSYSTGTSMATLMLSDFQHRFIIKENDEIILEHATISDNGTIWEVKTFKMPYQSELTNMVLNDLIRTGNCGLTLFQDSIKHHLSLINQFLAFMQKNGVNKPTQCLIT
jgi:hypothetical protein